MLLMPVMNKRQFLKRLLYVCVFVCVCTNISMEYFCTWCLFCLSGVLKCYKSQYWRCLGVKGQNGMFYWGTLALSCCNGSVWNGVYLYLFIYSGIYSFYLFIFLFQLFGAFFSVMVLDLHFVQLFFLFLSWCPFYLSIYLFSCLFFM